jgi:hypothetical protein
MTNNPTVRIIVTYGIIFQALIKSQIGFNIINFRSCLQMTRFNWTRNYDINIDELILLAPGQPLLDLVTTFVSALTWNAVSARTFIKNESKQLDLQQGNVKLPCAQLNTTP